jgi:hypothetical protein
MNSVPQTKKIMQVVLNKDFKGLSGNIPVRVTRCGESVADMLYMAKKGTVNVKKLDKDRYVIIGGENAGEIRLYQHTDTKQTDSLRKTFNNLRQLINTNFSVNDSELFLTFTYKENMQDAKTLMSDFDKFYKRLKYDQKDRELAYISIAEPQGRGAWHLHVLLKSVDGGKLYIDNRKMQDIWGHGWTETKRLTGDNPGAYFVAYFENTEVEHAGLIADPKKAKKYQKGGRLHFYPKDFKFFRCSRNIQKPIVEESTYAKVLAEFGQPIFSQAFDLMDGDEKKNLIVKQHFNKSRK